MAEKQLESSFVDKISLLNKIPALSNCLGNNDVPVPGYVYEEATRFSFDPSNESVEQLLSFLSRKLDRDEQPKTKLKTLKLMRFILINGDERFRLKLRKKDQIVKEAIGCIGPPDPIHGNSIYVSIRDEARDLLRVLFDETIQKETPSSIRVSLGGMGSSGKTGRFEGFGNSPMAANKTTMTSMVDGLSDVMDKILNAPYAQVEAVKSVLVMDVGDYMPVSVPPTDPLIMGDAARVRSVPTKQTCHVPGRPGGGWDDDDDDDDDYYRNCQKNRKHREQKLSCGLISVDSLEGENCIEREGDVNNEDLNAEKQLVDEIVNDSHLLNSWIKLDDICQRCNYVNCDKLLELLQERLIAVQEDNVKMAILMVVEAFITCDVIHFDQLHSSLENTLKQLQNTDSKDLTIKSTKILLILEKLRQSNDNSKQPSIV